MKNRAGRPTKYNQDLIKKSLEYLEAHNNPNDLPDIAGLCRAIGITRSTFYDWKKCKDKDTYTTLVQLKMEYIWKYTGAKTTEPQL